MTSFQTPPTFWQNMWAEIQDLKRRIDAVSTGDGQPRAAGSTGGPTSTTVHNHSDIASGGIPEYAPTTPANWNGSVDPGTLWQGIDQLAARVESIEINDTPAILKSLITSVGDLIVGGPGTATDPYRDAVIADSPRAYWRMSEASGNIADAINANTGVAHGGLTYLQTGPITGVADKAIAFNGSTGYFEAADANSLDLGDTFTLEVWVKKAADGSEMVIFDKGSNAYMLEISAGNVVRLAKQNVAFIVSSTTTITGTGYHHVVVTKSGSTIKIYIDKVDVTGSVSNQTCANNSSALEIGRAGSNDRFWNGSLAEPALYATALSAARVAAHYDAAVAAGSFTGIPVRFPVGTDGQVLISDSAQTDGLRWGAAGSGGLTFAAPVKIGTANATGSGTDVPHANHVHDGLGEPQGLTGAAQATRYVGATTSGAPVSGTFAIGDFVVDRTNGLILVCTVAGTPGTWVSGGSAPDASVVTYTPGDATDWSGSVDPGNVNGGLDQLADRLKTQEALTASSGTTDDAFVYSLVAGLGG